MGLSIILVLYVHTSLAPALTEMVEFFDTDYAVVSWVLTAYMVAGAASTIVIGKLADMYGAKRMLLLVFLCYTVGTALAGFSQEIYTLLVLRVLQGIAVALVPICVRIARELYPIEKFPMAQGVILSMYQAGSAIGLVLGAAVVYFGGWQSVFFTATPFAILFFFLLWKLIPNIPSHTPRTESKHQGKIIDIPGIITLILAVSTFMLSITFLGGSAETISLFWIFLVIGIVSLVAFLFIEKRSEVPLIDLKLAFHKIIRVGNVIFLMLGVVQYIIFSTVPTFAQTQQPYGLGIDTLYVGLFATTSGDSICSAGTNCRYSCHKIWKSKIYYPRFYCPDGRTLSSTILSFDICRSCKYTYTICCGRFISVLVCQRHHILYT